nr:PaaI family thioesterase [Caldovatus aquaticus]
MRRERDGGPLFGVLTDPRHNNGRGVVHGGILASIMDHALGKTVGDAVRPQRCATIQLDLHYLAPVAPGEFVTARCEVTRRTRSVVFVRGELFAGGRAVLAASGIWKVLESSRREGGEGGMA